MSNIDYSSIPNYVQNAESILVILDSSSGFDQQLAATSLYQALKEANKKVELLSQQSINNPTINALNDLKTSIGHNNLVVSFDYQQESVNNVSYHIDEDAKKFYLTIKPQKGAEPLDQETVSFDYTGAEADLIFLFGVNQLSDLDELYIGYEDVYDKATTVIIDDLPASFATFRLNTSLASSSCEIVYELIKNLDLRLNSELATNLLAGIQYETDNFVDSRASADTFEIIAELLRAGARRKNGTFKKEEKSDRDVKQDFPVKPRKEPQESGLGQEIEVEQQKTVVRPSGLKK